MAWSRASSVIGWSDPLFQGFLERPKLRCEVFVGGRILHAVRHGQVVVVSDRDMEPPTRKRLPQVDAGLGNHDAVQVVVSSQKPLRQAVATERTEHPKNVRLGYGLRLVAAQDANRQNPRRIHDLFGGIRTKVADDFSAGSLLPFFGIVMPMLEPVLEYLYHVAPPCSGRTGILACRHCGLK